MDLGTIKAKLEHHPERGKPRVYTTPQEVRDDIRQVGNPFRLQGIGYISYILYPIRPRGF